MGREAAPAGAAYSAFPIRLHREGDSVRFLYVRKHKCEPGGDADITDRTLFVAAVPASFSEQRLESLFGRYGDIERVSLLWLSTLPTPGAHILFKSAKAVKRVLEASQPGSPPAEAPPADLTTLSGLAKWIQAHRDARPGLDDLQQQVDSWVADFDGEQERQKRSREAAAADDDGWTVVASRKRGKTQDAAGTTSVAGVAPAVAERGRYKGLKTSHDFYRFQRREKQRNAVLELREKFQEDRQRIAELKAARKFKPQ